MAYSATAPFSGVLCAEDSTRVEYLQGYLAQLHKVPHLNQTFIDREVCPVMAASL